MLPQRCPTCERGAFLLAKFELLLEEQHEMELREAKEAEEQAQRAARAQAWAETQKNVTTVPSRSSSSTDEENRSPNNTKRGRFRRFSRYQDSGNKRRSWILGGGNFRAKEHSSDGHEADTESDPVKKRPASEGHSGGDFRADTILPERQEPSSPIPERPKSRRLFSRAGKPKDEIDQTPQFGASRSPKAAKLKRKLRFPFRPAKKARANRKGDKSDGDANHVIIDHDPDTMELDEMA
ncbi:hypothetical protein Dda_9062 [Drechslerella dactyloides]|uniref:Uncharacterized protein n=1 Tax=Drechslerella dactyloides TaxID=74499 RepID=A0AAD6ITN9_DREDA|nr:hypothetical protein Dda_9062 [Drechslerella dactyloides]